jgi:pSer/pThr/pTyr-binding forkhead associated (FHA) protein
MANNVLVTTDLNPPVKPGRHYRLLCLVGKNKGKVYYLIKNRIILGRGDTADVQVLDAKSSREHAELVLLNKSYVLTDLGSQNGVMVNDAKVKQQYLKNGDKIIIGQTVYKYSEYKNKGEEVEDEVATVKDEKQVDPEKKQKANRRMLILLVIIGVMYFMFFDNTEPQRRSKTTIEVNDITDDFQKRSSSANKQDKEKIKKVDAIMHRGIREYREKNYYRAINEFSLALIMRPGDPRANFYLNKTKQVRDGEIKGLFSKARKDFQSLKYKAAKIAYCEVIKLLEQEPEDQRFKDATENLREIERRMGLEEGEIKCIEE